MDHVVEDTAGVLAHGNIGVPVHTPIARPLVPDDPVSDAVGVVATATASPVAAVTVALLLPLSTFAATAVCRGEGVAHHLNAEVDVEELAAAAGLGRHDAALVVLPRRRVNANDGRTVRGDVADRQTFVLGVAVTPAAVGIAHAHLRGISVAIDVAVNEATDGVD